MKHALIITHFGSGGTLLCRILNENYNIRCIGRTNVSYTHPTMLERSRLVINSAFRSTFDHNDWYVDKLVNNFDFACKPLYKICKFIYMIRTPQVPLATLMSRGYLPSGAENYYLFRLRRLCEMAVKTGGVLLTYEDLVSRSAFPLLKNFLNLKSPLTGEFTPFHMDDPNLQTGKIINNPVEPGIEIPENTMKKCSVGYQKYLKFLESRTSLIRFVV